jgi:hypothetical protein
MNCRTRRGSQIAGRLNHNCRALMHNDFLPSRTLVTTFCTYPEPTPLTMPRVTDGSPRMSSAKPTATTSSPTSMEAAGGIAGLSMFDTRPGIHETSSTAKSESPSQPKTFASKVSKVYGPTPFLRNSTWTGLVTFPSSSETTWQFVSK